MEFQLKTLSPEAVARALARAERYRLLNEPGEAVSICLDALEVQPDNQAALTTLLLALTEQFENDTSCVAEAWTAVARLSDDYERAYYSGIVYERRAKSRLRHGMPGCGPQAYEWLRDAMTCTRRLKPFARPRTTMRCCDGMRAPGSSCAITIWCRTPKSAASRFFWNRISYPRAFADLAAIS